MTSSAIIGGTGLTQLDGLEIVRQEHVETPYGRPSAPLTFGRLGGGTQELIFLPRHGAEHTRPPHQINYRANIAALQQAGVKQIIAIAAVGGITPGMPPEAVIIPDQIIDYTWGRASTFFEEALQTVTHIDFTHPYSPPLRQQLLSAAHQAGITVIDGATYGCTQGPRLETIAEIRRMEQDGCDLVGMTGMPEAALARELGLDYASCAVVANWAAGKSDSAITMTEIEQNLVGGMQKIARLLRALLG